MRPGSKTSTLKKVSKIEGRSHIIANRMIQIKIVSIPNKLLGIIRCLPPGIKHKNKNIKGMKKAVKDVFSIPLVVLAKLKSVIDIAHIIPAESAIHSTIVEGKIIPFSTPIISTPYRGIPEQVLDGYNGYLIPPDDPESLFQVIKKLVKDPENYSHMSIASRKHFEENFTSPTSSSSLKISRACIKPDFTSLGRSIWVKSPVTITLEP